MSDTELTFAQRRARAWLTRDGRIADGYPLHNAALPPEGAKLQCKDPPPTMLRREAERKRP